MLKFGLALLGIAIFLNAHKKASASTNNADDASPDSEAPLPGGARPMSFEPSLDPALNGNPFLIGQPGGGDNPNTQWHPPNFLPGGNPGDLGGILNPGSTMDDDIAAGAISGSQLSAANQAYNKILSGIPARAKANYNAVRRALSWHKRVFHF